MNLAGHCISLEILLFQALYKLSFFRFGAKLWNEIPCHIRHLPKNNFKKNTLQITFWYFECRRRVYWYTHLHYKGKISQKCWKINSCLLVSTFTIYLFNSFFFIVLPRSHESILQFLFHIFANCKLSFIVILSLNFIFCTHCPASNSLASCRQCICNYIICLLINFVVAVMESQTDHFFMQHQLGHQFQDLGSQGPITAARNSKEPYQVSNVNALVTSLGRQQIKSLPMVIWFSAF